MVLGFGVGASVEMVSDDIKAIGSVSLASRVLEAGDFFSSSFEPCESDHALYRVLTARLPKYKAFKGCPWASADIEQTSAKSAFRSAIS